MYTYIKVKLECKIPIIATIESTKTISDHITIFSYVDGYITSSNKVKFLCFNLLGLYFKAGSTNFDIFCQRLVTKISNFLHNVQYLLYKIVLTLPKSLNLCPHTLFLVSTIASICNIDKIIHSRL